jgi:general stress protein 26
MSINGRAEISRDKNKIEELWEGIMKAWFTEGKDDPRITVIKVTPVDGYYWDTKHSAPVAFAKTAIGAMIGKTLDDSIEGKIIV